MYISCELIVLYSYLIRYSMEGPLAPYKQYTGANHHTAKLKPLVWCGIDFDAKAYIKAKTDGHEPTPLQELSFKIKCEAKGAQKAVDDKKAAEKEKNNKKRKKSEAAEVAMKIRDGPGCRRRRRSGPSRAPWRTGRSPRARRAASRRPRRGSWP